MSTLALACSVDELRAAAHHLRATGDEIEDIARIVAKGMGSGWTGVAAWQFQAVKCQFSNVLLGTVPHVLDGSSLVHQVCDRTEELQQRSRHWASLLQERQSELSRLLAVGTPLDVIQAEVWQRRVVELHQQIHQARQWLSDIESQAQQVHQQIAGQISEIIRPVQSLIFTAQAGWTAYQTFTSTKKSWGTTAGAAHWARQRWARTSEARQAAAKRVDASRDKIQNWLRKSGHLRDRIGQAKGLMMRIGQSPLGFVVSRVTFGIQVISAGSDLWTGGGYEGWRGDVTRTFAAGGLVGVPLLMLSATPAGAAVGLGLTTAYGAWMGGNWLWDNREMIGRTTARAWRGTRVWLGRANMPRTRRVLYLSREAVQMGSRAVAAGYAAGDAAKRAGAAAGDAAKRAGTAVGDVAKSAARGAANLGRGAVRVGSDAVDAGQRAGSALGKAARVGWRQVGTLLRDRPSFTLSIGARPGGTLTGAGAGLPQRSEPMTVVPGQLPEVSVTSQVVREMGSPLGLSHTPLSQTSHASIDMRLPWQRSPWPPNIGIPQPPVVLA